MGHPPAATHRRPPARYLAAMHRIRRFSIPHRARWCLAALGATLLLAACSSTDTSSPITASPTTASPTTGGSGVATTGGSTTEGSTAEGTTADGPAYLAGAAESGCVAGDTLEDGRWFGFVPIGGVHLDSGTMDFDLACWFAGPEAEAAGAARGEEVTNDYLVVNDNEQLRTVSVDAKASVTFFPTGDPADVDIVELANWEAKRTERGYDMAVWIDIVDGVVATIEERWVP